MSFAPRPAPHHLLPAQPPVPQEDSARVARLFQGMVCLSEHSSVWLTRNVFPRAGGGRCYRRCAEIAQGFTGNSPRAVPSVFAFALVSDSSCQLHPSSSVLDNYDCKFGGVSENEGVPFVTDFNYMLDELVEIIWSWVITCVSIVYRSSLVILSYPSSINQIFPDR
jgi:hypothetical protein